MTKPHPPKTPPPPQKPSLFASLIEEGSTLDGDLDFVDNPTEIPWFDPILFEKGRQFAISNFAVLQLVIIAANCVGFSGKQIAAVFFKNFYPQNTCGLRFLSTFRTGSDFLLSDDPTSLDSPFIRETRRVRKLHKIYARPKTKPLVPPRELEATYPPQYKELLGLIRADLEHVDVSEFPAHLVSWTPSMYFTQFDVAMVQLGPIAPLLLYPELVGLYTRYEDDVGLRGYFHVSAVLGRMLGLQDRFNLALPENCSRELYAEFVAKVGLPSWKLADETVIFAMTTLVAELNKMMPFLAITVKSLMYLTLRGNGVRGDNLWDSMGLWDKASVAGIQFGTYMFRFSLVRIVANYFMRWGLQFYYNIYLTKR